MQFIFVEFWIALEIKLYGVNHGHWHFVFGTELELSKLFVLFSSTNIFRKILYSERTNRKCKCFVFKVLEFTCYWIYFHIVNLI